MAERRLKVVTANSNFIGRVAGTIKKILVPTKLGVNNFLVTLKRSSYIKAYKTLEKIKEGNSKEKREIAEKELSIAYEEYLEAIDKYVMDSVYTKASSNNATKIEKKALSDYYKITTYKSEQYDEYKYRKQIFLLSLDYNIQKERYKKTESKYEELYAEKQTDVYRGLLKHYSIRLIDNTSKNSVIKNDVFLSIFRILNDYVMDILPLAIKYSKTKKYNSILPQYDAYKSYRGKLDEKENLEKKMLLLSLSRTLFTHSLPLGIVEKSYQKLISDTRILLVRSIGTKKEEKVFSMIKLIVEEFNNKILVGKIYWEDKEEKKEVQEFWNKYKQAKTEKERDILLCLEELRTIAKETTKLANKDIKKYYKNKLKTYGARIVNGYVKREETKIFKRTINEEISNIA